MPNNIEPPPRTGVGAWSKRFTRTSQTALDAVLREHDLGSGQWYVLHHLATEGPLTQRDLTERLGVERATVSGIVSILARKGLVEQTSVPGDARLRQVELTETGRRRCDEVPDPIGHLGTIAFAGIDQVDLEVAVQVLQRATTQIEQYLKKEPRP